MALSAILALALSFLTAQADERPAYAREGDRVEQEFLAERDRLTTLYATLRNLLGQQPAGGTAALPPLQPQDAPPAAGSRFGYGVLPKIIDSAKNPEPPVSVFSYSWPITEGYIAGERVKIDRAEESLQQAASASEETKAKIISSLITEYRNLMTNHRTIDQYIQYNQFWQRSIWQDRARFDKLTKVYELMKSDEPDITQAIREVLGKPEVPSFITTARTQVDRIVVRVPLYTDIQDQDFLATAKQAIENLWQARDGDTAYALEIDIRQVPPMAERGERVDVRAIASRFPADGAVLTTGAQTTHSLVGRYIALAPGDLSTRTLAHEFGHVLGFHDGYIRGYRDLGDQGFEIMELTSIFDDIMSAPREGHVQAAHFKLMMDSLK
jgi:hypothetical protein